MMSASMPPIRKNVKADAVEDPDPLVVDGGEPRPEHAVFLGLRAGHECRLGRHDGMSPT
jgi:hypothetical protein